ncbi:MAG: MATE family efflux transporter, partial [Pseudoruegeria sp.]
MANEQAKFLEGSLFKHVAVMSFTASVGLMAVFFVDFVDMIFISMLGESELAAAVGYAGAILFFTTSLGIGMSISAGALVARSLGEGDADLARAKATHTLVYGIVMGVVLAVTVWLNLHTLTGWIGATGETQKLAVGYLKIIIPSMPFMLSGMVASAVLRGHGDARRAMYVTLWGGGVNAVLDPIFIFALGLDLQGAALASVVARVTMSIAGIIPIIRYYGGFSKINVKGLVVDFKPIFAIALPAILTQMATPFSSAYITRAMAEYGEQAVAGMAVVG